MNLAFDEVKATQAGARFLRLSGGSLNYMALIKLLYKADREAIRRFGLPITTDKYASLDKGPITSRIYDLIKSSHPSFWSSHIARKRLDVNLQADPGESELSPAEEKLIDEIFSTDGHKDRFDLVDECHENYPEWRDPHGSSLPLDIGDILAALELSEEEVRQTETLIEKQRASAEMAV